MLATVLLVASVIALFAIAARRDAPSVRNKLLLVPLGLAILGMVAIPSAFVFNKWLGRMAMPPAIVGLALLALSVAALRARGRGAFALTALFVGYWVLTNNWSSQWCATLLEEPFATRPTPAHYDAVAVLGGGVSYRPWGEPQLSMAGDRVATAAELYHHGRASLLVCAGPVIGTRDGAADAMYMFGELGVPPMALLRVEGPRNTSEEIAAFAELARARGWRRLAIVTSAWHLRRAMHLARGQGITVTPLAADFLGGPIEVSVEDLWPSSVALYRMQVVSWELLGMAMGR
ncbi:MAG TPA: YdcF family protein [Polyangiaceae bacterium]|nr:YdcF family protein [Polyangiaceae bacterium]